MLWKLPFVGRDLIRYKGRTFAAMRSTLDSTTISVHTVGFSPFKSKHFPERESPAKNAAQIARYVKQITDEIEELEREKRRAGKKEGLIDSIQGAKRILESKV